MVEREEPEVPIAVRCDELIEIPDLHTIFPSFDILTPIPVLVCCIKDAEMDEEPEELSICRSLKKWQTLNVLPMFIPRCHLCIINNFTKKCNYCTLCRTPCISSYHIE